MAGLASHPSAEPGTLVVRASYEEREWLLEDAPETYYLTDYYRKYPLILVRLSRIQRDALHDLLSVSWRLTAAKTEDNVAQVGQLTGGVATALVIFLLGLGTLLAALVIFIELVIRAALISAHR